MIAAHPDDEVLGMGATIKKLTNKKKKIRLCVVSEGASAQYKDERMIKVREEACKKSAKILGISGVNFLGFPDMKLDSVSHLEINVELEKIIEKYQPETVYTTPFNDLNIDHQKVFESTLVATRTLTSPVKHLLCYELPGLMRTPFQPLVYEEISKEFSYKIKALKVYRSELKKFPHARSMESIKNLAIHRGIEAGLKKAEAFQLIRSVSE